MPHAGPNPSESILEQAMQQLIERSTALLTAPGTGRDAVTGFLLQCAREASSVSDPVENDGASPEAHRHVFGLAEVCIALKRLRSPISTRFERSIDEGELPEDADLESLGTLCVVAACGLLCSDGLPVTPPGVQRAVHLLTEKLGFHPVRSSALALGRASRRRKS